jgi:hypothetical protein
LLGFLVASALIGCSNGSHPADRSAKAEQANPVSPEQALYDQVRSGAYQISAAIDSIEDVRKTMREMASREAGATQKAHLTITGDLDDDGTALADFGDDPPTFNEFKKNFAAQDDRRLKAIDAANESLDDLHDAQDVVGDLLDSLEHQDAGVPQKAQLDHADTVLDGCVEGVEGAIKAMGGKVTSTDSGDGK